MPRNEWARQVLMSAIGHPNVVLDSDSTIQLPTRSTIDEVIEMSEPSSQSTVAARRSSRWRP